MATRLLFKNKILLAGIVLFLSIAGVLLFYYSMSETVSSGSTEEVALQEIAFVDNQSCAGCHAQQFDEWLGSHHDQAMKAANSQTVLGDFNDAEFREGGVTSRFIQREDDFFIHTQGEDGSYADFKVQYTFGIEPLQQYLLELPRGRLQAFTVAWDTEQKRWFSLYPDEEIVPDDPLHWTGRAFTANSSCIECHTTNMALNYDLESDSYETSWDEVNVSCQACHGPANEHIKWAQGEDSAQESESKGFLVNYRELAPQVQAETCARCHSLRYSVSENDSYDHTYFDDFMPELLREGYYHADGQILGEVYVYGSFIQSKMYHEDVTCMNCHNPHTLELHTQGNQLCTSCHQLNPPNQQFETLQAKAYDTPEHHFHAEDSAGAQCVNCHMPSEDYMIVDPRRDHKFSIPRPDLSLEWGTPNACTECHIDAGDNLDEVAEWSVQAMDEWYGPQWQERPDVVGIMALAREGDPIAEIPLMEVINDPNQPAITRATAIELMTQYGPRGLNSIANALYDESPVVRASALRGLENLSNEHKLQILEPLLADPVRGVRIEAARGLATIPKNDFSPASWQIFEEVLAEYKSAQFAQADHPEGYVNSGNLYVLMGQADQAEDAYHTAIIRDKNFLPAYNNLATFYYQTGRLGEAENIFQEAARSVSQPGSFYYSLGLLMVEQERLDEAVENFARASELLPGHQRLHYNYGLLLRQVGKLSQAEETLVHANTLSLSDQDTLLALVDFYIETEEWKKGLAHAEELYRLNPNAPQFINLVNSIREEIQQAE